MDEEVMLTTIDNPFNPFDDFADWYTYDVGHGYNTCGYLARVCYANDSMPEKIYNEEVDRAIDEIVELNLRGIYKKVTRDDYKDGKWTKETSELLNALSKIRI